MKRINLNYGGVTYSIADRDPDDLQREIAAGLASGEAYWLVVNWGEGTPREARLLITPGVDLAIVAVPEPVQRETSDEPVPPPAR